MSGSSVRWNTSTCWQYAPNPAFHLDRDSFTHTHDTSADLKKTNKVVQKRDWAKRRSDSKVRLIHALTKSDVHAGDEKSDSALMEQQQVKLSGALPGCGGEKARHLRLRAAWRSFSSAGGLLQICSSLNPPLLQRTASFTTNSPKPFPSFPLDSCSVVFLQSVTDNCRTLPGLGAFPPTVGLPGAHRKVKTGLRFP